MTPSIVSSRVAVIGSGYVGLVTGACLAASGHCVICVDTSQDRVDCINRGQAPFHEPGLAAQLAEGLAAGRLTAITSVEDAVRASDITIIAVPTPFDGRRIDLTHVERVAAMIGSALRTLDRYHVVVVKSTVVPGTTDGVVRLAIERSCGLAAGDFGLCMNPEFLREGSAVADFMQPDRIVIGAWDARAARPVSELYAGYDCPNIITTLRNAEFIKYTSNAFLASLISFSNEIANLCELLDGADAQTVFDAIHLDRRFGNSLAARPEVLGYLRPGAGFGGSCLPKDVNALRAFASAIGAETPVLDAVMNVNSSRARHLVSLLEDTIGSVRGRFIAVLGLAFKAGTDDCRDSPALRIVDELEQRGASVRGYDPLIENVASRNGDIPVHRILEAALKGADGAIITAACPELRTAEWSALCGVMRHAAIIDGRGLLIDMSWPENVVYRAVGDGRPPVAAGRAR